MSAVPPFLDVVEAPFVRGLSNVGRGGGGGGGGVAEFKGVVAGLDDD